VGLAMLAVVAAVPLILVASVLHPGAGSNPGGGPGVGAPSALALADIPPEYLAAYQHAATTVKDVPWWIIAAIGKEETDHGRSTLPGVHSGTNSAGAAGPMQFLLSTWSSYKRECGGGGNVYDIRDASCGTAAYIQALLNEHGGDMGRAIFGYNHAAWYVADILRIAATYYVQVATAVVNAATGALGKLLAEVHYSAGTIAHGFGTILEQHPYHSGEKLFAGVPGDGFPHDTYAFGQCTWWAAINHNVDGHMGDGGTWIRTATALHLAVSNTPSVGAVVSYAPGKYSGYGHVAVVILLDKEHNAIVVSESNVRGLGIIDTRVNGLDDPDIQGFIAA